MPAGLEPLELDGLVDHDGWSEREVTGSAIAADAEHVGFGGCRIAGVRLTGARLFKAELVDVVLTDCDLAGAVLEELSLDRVAFVGCRLSGADLGGATLRDVSFRDCQLDELGLRLARTERLEVHGGTAAQLDAYDAWLTASRWTDVDLTGADLTKARLGRARFGAGSRLVDVRGAAALAGSSIDPTLAVDVGHALLADLRIAVEDDDT
ncbi:MAG: pentapeptide repeat-containing protein [Acidimicrobiales bacterium]